MLGPRERIAECIRIASEYRLREELDPRKIDDPWAEPEPASEAVPGKVSVEERLVRALDFAFKWPKRRKLARVSNPDSGRRMFRHAADGIEDILTLWRQHGLPGFPGFNHDLRVECAVRWADTLYGDGTADRLHLRQRIEDRMNQQAKGHAQASSRGARVTFVDATEAVLREIAEEVPPIAQD